MGGIAAAEKVIELVPIAVAAGIATKTLNDLNYTKDDPTVSRNRRRKSKNSNKASKASKAKKTKGTKSTKRKTTRKQSRKSKSDIDIMNIGIANV